MNTKLSPSAQKTIHDYLNLPFIGISGVRCPYFNNARAGQRGQLKVLIGKGTPEEIVEEAKIISIQYNTHFDHPAEHEKAECIQQFLVDNNLGIDCSGFVTNVLQQHFRESKGVDLARKLFVTPKKNLLRWIISRLRPVEQISVNVYANNANTTVVNDLPMIQPADLIVLLKTGPNKNHNHIMLVEEVEENTIKYTHARAWSSDGKYGHGVAQGTITITDPEKGLLEQVWEEKDKTDEKNETYLEARQAGTLEIRRIKL